MYLSLCLIAKDENSYLEEWLDYHILLGVEHFWIYDNESETPVKETLKKYIDDGWVTIHTIKGHGMQLAAYDHCIQTYGAESTWIGFIDTDEFLVPINTCSLQDFLKPYEPHAGLAISSLFFGNGGNKTRPLFGQLDAYRIRTPEKFSLNRLVKMIVQPVKVILPISPHSFLFKEGHFCVNEKGLRVDAQQFPCHVDEIQVNHYFTRSEEEWKKKLSRGRGDSGNPYSDDRWLKISKYSNVADRKVLDLLQKILHKPVRTQVKNKGLASGRDCFLLNEIHELAMKQKPVPSFSNFDEEIIPRQDILDYLAEISRGFNLLDAGNIIEAREFYLEQIKSFPFDVMRYTNFASVCIQCKDFKNAWASLAEAWRIAPQSLYVLLCMIDYFYAIGDFLQVEKICRLAEAQGDLEPTSVAIKALALWKQGKEEEATLTAKKILPRLQENDLKKPHFKDLFNIFSKK